MSLSFMLSFLLLLSSAAVANADTGAAPKLGPMSASVERVVDGDTVRVRVAIWLDQEIRVAVRLAEVDAPEIMRPACAGERALGHSAKAFAEDFLKGRQVTIHDVRRDKYGGRVAARIEADGEDLGRALINAGLGSRDFQSEWCDSPKQARPS